MDTFKKDMKNYLVEIEKSLLQYVGDRIFESLQKNILEKMYQPENRVYTPGNNANPTREFYNAVDITAIHKFANKLGREIIYNWQDKMSNRNELYTYVDRNGNERSYLVHIHEDIHGNDVRKELFEILQERNKRGCIPYRPVSHYDNFWEEFVNDVESNIKQWISKALKSFDILGIEVDFKKEEIGGSK